MTKLEAHYYLIAMSAELQLRKTNPDIHVDLDYYIKSTKYNLKTMSIEFLIKQIAFWENVIDNMSLDPGKYANKIKVNNLFIEEINYFDFNEKKEYVTYKITQI